MESPRATANSVRSQAANLSGYESAYKPRKPGVTPDIPPYLKHEQTGQIHVFSATKSDAALSPHAIGKCLKFFEEKFELNLSKCQVDYVQKNGSTTGIVLIAPDLKSVQGAGAAQTFGSLSLRTPYTR